MPSPDLLANLADSRAIGSSPHVLQLHQNPPEPTGRSRYGERPLRPYLEHRRTLADGRQLHTAKRGPYKKREAAELAAPQLSRCRDTAQDQPSRHEITACNSI